MPPQFESCKLCERYKEGRCRPVGAEVAESPPVLVVVDAPLSKEDVAEGRLMAGARAGLHLAKILGKAGLNRTNCRVTSLLKCGYSEPTEDQVEKCKGWLWKEEILLGKPKVILALGKRVSSLLLKKSAHKVNLSEVAGTLSEVNYLAGATLAIWYSPVYVFNQGVSVETKTVEFFKKVREYAGIPSPMALGQQ